VSPSRIDELRRRVQNDPASIAFAQLAEEYRRSGLTDEAVRICREGLTRHPGYLSARVTLGRALLDLEQLDEARGEFEFVVAEAPENLAAVRGLAEIFHRDGQTAEALTYYRRALALARHDPEIEEIVQQLSRQMGAEASAPAGGLSFEEAHEELLSAAERVPLAPPAPARSSAEGATAPFDFDRLVAALGSPSAPPQLEAAVAGHDVPALELPDVVDLGPNPFAALEAELRAHETVGAEAPIGRPWEPPAVALDMTAAAVEAAQDTIETIETVDASDLAGLAGVATEFPARDLAAADDAEPTAFALETEAVETAAVETETAVAVATVELAEATAPAEPGAPAGPEGGGTPPADVTPPREDVLGDLESWLDTLHDRPAD
jgi:hypothetical protein